MIMLKSYDVHLSALIKRKRIVLAGPVFNLHTKFTAALLLLFCALLTCNELLIKKGKPISCFVEPERAKDMPTLKKVMESYCWIQNTFLLSEYNMSTQVAHPGLTNHRGIRDYNIKYYAYYQWVTFALFFQSFFCYLPWALWKRWESGLMRVIVMGLNLSVSNKEKEKKKNEKEQKKLRKKEENEKEQKMLVEYLIKHLNLHTKYAVCYWTCEFICFVWILSQMVLMDWLFDGEFMKYGLNIMGLLELGDVDPQTRFDPFIFIFPRVTKCLFRFFGPSKTIQSYDTFCILSLNNTNEKIYMFIWFWYTILIALSIALFIYRALIILLPSFRQCLIGSQNRMVTTEAAEVISKISVCDWWIFYMLGENVDPVLFSEIAVEFAKQHTALMVSSKETKFLQNSPPLRAFLLSC